MIETIMRLWSRVETLLIGLCLLAALTVFLGGGLLRAFAPAHAIDWAEEVALYFIIWATALSGSVLVHEKRHISTEVFTRNLSPGAQRRLALAMLLLTLVFCAAMTVFGWQAVDFALMLDERSASTLRVPQGHALFLALPVGMGLIVLRLILLLFAGNHSLSGDLHADTNSGSQKS